MLLILLLGTVICYANTYTGAWSGELNVQGIKLPLVFHLDENNPTLDSPAQGVKGIPMKVTISANDSISINIPLIGASFTGSFKDSRLTGTFTQRGMSFPLILSPGENIPNRPQTPRPPYPYSQEEVSFENGDATLKGTLTLPEGYDRETPVLILITGSGSQNRDEEVFNHKPFAVIADALARNGIATLRYDDRGFAESTGDAVNCTTADLAADALAGIELLRNRFNNVGALGHSEGGTIAMMLGAENKVDFIVCLAGMAISGKETLMNQNRYALSKAGYSQAVIDEYCDILSLLFRNDSSALQRMENSELPVELKRNLQTVRQQISTPYMQYFLALDIKDKLGKIDCPVLALNGTKDTQVSSRENLDALKKGLPVNSINLIRELEGLNHLFQHCSIGSVDEYAMIEETIAPEILEIITGWLKSL